MFDNNTKALESFMDYSAMMIAEEGFLLKALSKLQTLFAKLILKIDKMVKKMKDNRLKKVLTNLLSRAKRGLSKSKSLKEHNPDMVRELQEEYNEINEEVQEVVKEDATKDREDDKEHHKYLIFMTCCKKKELRLTHIHMKDQCTLDATNGTNVCTDMIKYAARYYGDKLFDKHDGDLIHDNPSDYTKDDYNKESVALMSNFSKERYQMLRTVAKRLFSKK